MPGMIRLALVLSSPLTNSRFTSNPTKRKKMAINASLTHSIVVNGPNGKFTNDMYCVANGELATIKAIMVAPSNTVVAAPGERKNTNIRSI